MSLQDFSKAVLMRKGEKTRGEALNKLQKIIEEKYSVKIGDRHDFHKWSVEHMVEFWSEYWDYIGIISSKKFDQVIDLNVSFSDMPEWFQGARLNFAENLLKYNDDRVAIISTGEDKVTEYFTSAQMNEKVKEYAAAFKNFGLKKGDVVAGYISSRIEAVFTMIASISIGAIWTACIPFLDSQAVISTFQSVKPKILITVDRFKNNNLEIELLQKVKEIVDDSPSVEKVLIVPTKPESKFKDVSGIRGSCFLDDFLETGRSEDGAFPELRFEQVSFSHPVSILCSSGTTGVRKEIVHGCGALIPAAQIYLHSDSSRGSVWFFPSPVGVVSWNAGVSLLACGITILLFEGEPCLLSPSYFWDFVDKFGCENLYLSVNLLDQLEKHNCLPSDKNDLKTLKGCVSGGSPIKPQMFDFMYEKVKSDILFSSTYGTTETGLIAATEPTMPVYRGEIPVKFMGVDIQCVDKAGQPVEGKVGEVIISQPYPGLPIGLWNDPGKIKYKNSYFQNIPGKFAFKDNAVVNPLTKGITIFGRSDSRLKQRGQSFESSEIYNIVELLPEVCDSVCISQCNKDMKERAVLFLKMRDNHRLDEDLLQRIRQKIASELSPAHVPEVITTTEDIPYTINGKKLEMTVKNIINNRPYAIENIRNPECLKNFVNNPDIKEF